MSAVDAVASTVAGGQASNQDSVDQAIMNFAMAMAQNTRSEMSDELNKLEHKWEQIKQEQGER
jgi:hypothetical protein